LQNIELSPYGRSEGKRRRLGARREFDRRNAAKGKDVVQFWWHPNVLCKSRGRNGPNWNDVKTAAQTVVFALFLPIERRSGQLTN
jgi:hypothetical protein